MGRKKGYDRFNRPAPAWLRGVYFSAGAACVAYYFVIGFASRFGLSMSLLWPALGGLFIAVGLLSALRLPRWLRLGWRALLCLGLCCSATYGINPMLTTLIPMEYERAGRVGLVAGMSDCFIYLGSSLAGVVTGAISDSAGWSLVFTMWCAVALVSLALAFLSMRGGRRLEGYDGRERA